MRVTEVTRTRFWSVNLRLRCVRELNNTPSILCALFLPQTKIYPTEILRPPSAYLRDILGAEDEIRYSPFEDDKPKRAVNTRSEAGSDNFCHPPDAGICLCKAYWFDSLTAKTPKTSSFRRCFLYTFKYGRNKHCARE